MWSEVIVVSLGYNCCSRYRLHLLFPSNVIDVLPQFLPVPIKDASSLCHLSWLGVNNTFRILVYSKDYMLPVLL
jgi:hypothetical protein